VETTHVSRALVAATVAGGAIAMVRPGKLVDGRLNHDAAGHGAFDAFTSGS
jgi:hypothetical protein